VRGSGLLVDTSAWVEVFRRPQRIRLAQIAEDLDRVVTCLPVIQEVLQGFDDERAFRIAHTAMYAWPCVSLR
jgi:predicted nucleic acid-binding protein